MQMPLRRRARRYGTQPTWAPTRGANRKQMPQRPVDNNPSAVKLTREMTSDRPLTFCVLADAVGFLRALSVPVDLLYLDGPHPDREDGRRWHFDAYQAASTNQRSVVLIDDTDLPRLGKAEFVVPAALEDGFQVVASDRQTLLVR